MFKSLKIFLLVLSLGIFLVPKQIVFAQQNVACCDLKTENNGCCKTEKQQPCHDNNSKKNSDKNDCGKDCANCHTCSLFSLMNFVSPETHQSEKVHFVYSKVNFTYGVSFISSDFHNIWQPPKIF